MNVIQTIFPRVYIYIHVYKTPVMKIEKVNIREKLNLFNDHWNPKILGELNGQHVKAAKSKGKFVRHHHEREPKMNLKKSDRWPSN